VILAGDADATPIAKMRPSWEKIALPAAAMKAMSSRSG
jgi:hypothetical protein